MAIPNTAASALALAVNTATVLSASFLALLFMLSLHIVLLPGLTTTATTPSSTGSPTDASNPLNGTIVAPIPQPTGTRLAGTSAAGNGTHTGGANGLKAVGNFGSALLVVAVGFAAVF
ncbi:hypothetical protein B0J14DRAFT_606470 [Halenospora varia]|nr:hypothetical protein B0J14DRAFT_606470 [Halenospora varia]